MKQRIAFKVSPRFCVERLLRFPNLASLNLFGSETITDAAVSKLTNLTSLDLRGNETISDAAVLGSRAQGVKVVK